MDDAYAKLDLQLTCEIIDNWMLKFCTPTPFKCKCQKTFVAVIV